LSKLRKKKIFILVTFSLILSCFISGIAFIVQFNLYERHLIHIFQNVILRNNSTILFECDEFASQKELEEILSSDSSEVQKLIKYLDKNKGTLHISKTNNISFTNGENNSQSRCPNKYRFEVLIVSDREKQKVEEILENQRLEGIPIFIRNT
jgi:phosphopantetheine adenylyltransferase